MNENLNEQASTFTISAVVVGLLIIPNLNAKQQNDLGNWLMLVGQVLCTNAYYKQVQQERATNSQNNQACGNLSTEENIEMLKKMVNALNQEINNLKSNNRC